MGTKNIEVWKLTLLIRTPGENLVGAYGYRKYLLFFFFLLPNLIARYIGFVSNFIYPLMYRSGIGS